MKIQVPPLSTIRAALAAQPAGGRAGADGGGGVAVGVSVLANVSNSNGNSHSNSNSNRDGGGAAVPFGGVLTVVNFTAATPDANGTITALASIVTLDPCGGGSAPVPKQVPFAIRRGETTLMLRILVDRSIVEAFVMGGRAVLTKAFNPSVLYVPDTHVAVHAWGSAAITVESLDVFAMGCGWASAPYQANPTVETISMF